MVGTMSLRVDLEPSSSMSCDCGFGTEGEVGERVLLLTTLLVINLNT